MDDRASALSKGRNRISVALCTFNGEQFLPKQLASIETQTRLPDEVVICDDCSSDGTLDILHNFVASAPFPVKVLVNEENLGSTRNFEKAIRACTGDLIALSDQDDIWYPTRLERSEQEFLRNSSVGLVFSDADLIDDQDQLLGRKLWESLPFTEKERRQISAGEYSVCLSSRFVTGATVMFRANLRDRFLPVAPGWIHDEWIAAATPAFADLKPIEIPLIRYRRHLAQQVGLLPPLTSWQRARKRWNMLSGTEEAEKHWRLLSHEEKKTQALCRTLSTAPLEEVGHARLSSYQAYLRFLSIRSGLPPQRLARLRPITAVLSRYVYHTTWTNLMKDLLLSRSS